MKPLSAFLLLLLAAGSARAQSPAPLYLNLGSHNEIRDSADQGLHYISDSADYNAIRALSLEIADTVFAHGARWNAMYDSNFIRACLHHENGAVNANDLIQYLDALPEAEVDPHNHFDTNTFSANYNPYNYPDLAHLLDSCGLPAPRTNMGGFIWRNFPPNVNEDWSAYQTPQPGNVYPNYSWQPVVLWGGGSPGHINDFRSFGVWKPAAPTQMLFGQHAPANFLTCIGNGCSEGFLLTDTSTVAWMISQVESLLYFISQQPPDPNAFWTATIMMNHKHFQSANYVAKLGQLLGGLDAYTQSGQIVWATTSEKHAAWLGQHSNPNDFFNHPCSGIPLETQELAETRAEIFPNPSSTQIEIHFPGEGSMRLFDLAGRCLLNEPFSTTARLDVSVLPAGIYQLAVETGAQRSTRKIIVRKE